MLTGIIVCIGIAVCGMILYDISFKKKAETQKYYDAAYKVMKESCLDHAIRSRDERVHRGQKLMLYLKWTDSEKRGYVFDPERTVRIGRDFENSDICIREETVSSRHCVLFLYQGALYLQDLNSRNGTWLKRGLGRQQVQGTAPVFSGDKILVGSLTIKVTVFTFDMAYM